jgi:hypothetical protein
MTPSAGAGPDASPASRPSRDSSGRFAIRERHQGNNTGDEPTKLGCGPDATHCRYTAAGITCR